MTRIFSYLWHHCWHRNFTWPMKLKKNQPSYQICLDCGARRRYDMKTMRADWWWTKSVAPKKAPRRTKKAAPRGKLISIAVARPSVAVTSGIAVGKGGYSWNAYLSKLF